MCVCVLYLAYKKCIIAAEERHNCRMRAVQIQSESLCVGVWSNFNSPCCALCRSGCLLACAFWQTFRRVYTCSSNYALVEELIEKLVSHNKRLYESHRMRTNRQEMCRTFYTHAFLQRTQHVIPPMDSSFESNFGDTNNRFSTDNIIWHNTHDA